MKRRTVIWLGSLLAGSLVAGASAVAMAGQGDAPMVIDEALHQAQATPEQRGAIHASGDRRAALRRQLEEEQATAAGAGQTPVEAHQAMPRPRPRGIVDFVRTHQLPLP